MRVVIVGGHGKIALRLAGRLVARGVGVVGLIREQGQAGEIRALGGEAAVCDVEQASVPEIADAIGRADAVLFAAGAGPGSVPERKLTVDRDGAIKALQASVAADVPRYLIISSVGAEDPPDGDDVFSVYLRAKAEADAAVQASDRDWTILRPGRLTDDPGRGRVRISREPFSGEIPRDDVAATLDELLRSGRPSRVILYVNGGQDPIAQALEGQVRPRPQGVM
jgi:nucleoside-diphosphate-sugar epimerase